MGPDDSDTAGRADHEPATRSIPTAELDEAAAGDREPTVESLIGKRLGRYAVLQRLGAGGMGEVLLGYDPELDRRVAIKLILPDLGDGDRELFRSRLLREAQALAKVSHPNVVTVYDVGTALDRIWVAMELVEGITLAKWKRQPHTWREVVAVVSAAGAGLAAAHREGIVHRDFKPGNVMVDGSGRVRVLDFGLARRVASLSGPVSNSSDSLPVIPGPVSVELPPDASEERPLTVTGLLMGTPAYMAPEQFRGGHLDTRTDQFALSVVLWELLFGQRPFIARERARLARKVLAGKIVEPPRGHGVPNRVRRVVERGLAVRRDDRFPDVETLLAELQRASRPFGGISRAVPVVAIAGALIGAVALRSETAAAPCEGAPERMRPTWNEERKAGIVEAFTATDLAFATETAQRTTAIIDTYATEWIDAHRDACEATQVRGEQSAALMDLRMACLDLRRNEVGALVDVLSEGRASVVEQSVQAATRLESIAPCADPAYLQASVRPPDPDMVQGVAAQRTELVRGKALFVAGDYLQAVEVVRGVLTEADALGYAPLMADTGLILGRALQRAGQPDEARDVLSEALQYAAAADHRYAEAQLLADLAGNLGYYAHDLAGAKRYAAHARGVLSSIGNAPVIASQLLTNEGNALLSAGHFDAAHAKYEAAIGVAASAPAALSIRLTATSNQVAALGALGRYADAVQAARTALSLCEAELGPQHPMVGTAAVNAAGAMLKAGQPDDAEPLLLRAQSILGAAFPDGHPELAKALHNHGSLLSLRNDHEASLRKYERSLAMKTATMGPKHPSTALTVHAIGDELRALGRNAEARGRFSEALEMWEDSVGAEHPLVAYALVGLGEVALANRQAAKAIDVLDRALQIRAKAGIEGEQLGEARFALARALRLAGRDPQRAVQLARDARVDYGGDDTSGDAAEVAKIDRWLAAAPSTPATDAPASP